MLKGINHKDNFDGMTQWWLKVESYTHDILVKFVLIVLFE
jgi:hypothetical protein